MSSTKEQTAKKKLTHQELVRIAMQNINANITDEEEKAKKKPQK